MSNKFRGMGGIQPPQRPPVEAGKSDANKIRQLTPLPVPQTPRVPIGPGDSNKFRQIEPPQIGPKQRLEEAQGDFDLYHGEKSGQLLPLNSSAIAEHVRVLRGQLTKDVGWSQLGTPIGTIIGLFEHKWQFGGSLFARVLRIFNLAGVTRSQYWDGYTWVEAQQASEPMQSVYLSEVSIQGLLCLADGKVIMKWGETILTMEMEEDFTPGTYLYEGLGSGACSDAIVLYSAGAVANQYTVHFSITWDNIPTTETAVVEIVVMINGVEYIREPYRYTPGVGVGVPVPIPSFEEWFNISNTRFPDNISILPRRTVQDLSLPFHRELVADDTVAICLGDITGVIVDHLDIPLYLCSYRTPELSGGILNVLEKIWFWSGFKLFDYGDAETLDYTFRFRTNILPGETLEIVFSVAWPDTQIGSPPPFPPILTESRVYTNTNFVQEITDRQETFEIANIPARYLFSITVGVTYSSPDTLAMPFAGDGFAGPPLQGPCSVEVEDTSGGSFSLDYTVKPYNKAYDGDPEAGLTYEIITGMSQVFERLSPHAPGARYIFSFADRLIALQDYGDRQCLAWCTDGILEDWLPPLEGGTGDANRMYLLDAQIDPIDDLMAGAHIGGGNFALYRKRSIWRGFETGNVAQAIGVVPWVAGIGTEFRFSLQIVPGGNIFLGSDSMVYYFTEGGQLTPVGGPIIDEIHKRLTAENIRVDYDLVDSLFDSWLQHYWLAIPEDGAEFCTAIWIFDFGLFMREQKIHWRKRPMPNGVRRIAAVTMLPEPES